MKTTTISYSLLISSLLVQVLSLPERILLGGLFDIGDDEEEFAFRLAVDRTNADINILARSTVVAHMERLDRYDNFRATKKATWGYLLCSSNGMEPLVLTLQI
ncbi:uncharacterized protein LOC143250402 isoform X2 [Tachypleus tridentatus]|uniref:uncharacterized protein LOC143250402 isoform X2 n=1 Tax=Tachypleus tridentatus TaxID=6853 RepID=UPI003FD101ED